MLKILVPVNGSECSLKAVDEAIRSARAGGNATIQLVNVQPRFPRHIARFLPAGQTEDVRITRARQALEVARQRVDSAGLRYTTHMLYGRIVPAVAAFAAENGTDQIVVGTSPARSLTRLLHESIADGLIERATVPVEVVRGGKVGVLERFGVPAGLGLGLTLLWLSNE